MTQTAQTPGVIECTVGKLKVVGTGFLSVAEGFATLNVYEDGLDVTAKLAQVHRTHLHDALIKTYMEAASCRR